MRLQASAAHTWSEGPVKDAVIWIKSNCPPDKGLEIRAMYVWGRARWLSATETPYDTESLWVDGEKHFLSLESKYQIGYFIN